MIIKTSIHTLCLPNNMLLPLTNRHTLEFQRGTETHIDHVTQHYNYRYTGYNRLILTLPDGRSQAFGYTAILVHDNVIRPIYDDLALALYTSR